MVRSRARSDALRFGQQRIPHEYSQVNNVADSALAQTTPGNHKELQNL